MIKQNFTKANRPNKSPIVNSFYDGLSARKKINLEQRPIPHASYKLREVAGQLRRLSRAISLYGPGVRSGKIPDCLGPCMGFEAEDYFKQVPERVGFYLGHDVVGVLGRLVGDGMQISEIQSINRRACKRLPAIFELGDEALVELRTQWKVVESDLGGRSTLDEYLESCSQLLKSIMKGVR